MPHKPGLRAHECVECRPVVSLGKVYLCPLHAAAPALLEALEAANVPHTMPAVHKMVETVAGCPGCMARAAIAQAKGETV